MRRTLFSVAVGLVMSMMAVHVKPANADECPQFSKDTRDIVARAVRDVVSENTSIGPSMSRSTVIGRVLEFTMMRVHVRDQARVANEIRSAFTGSDDAIFEMIKVCFPSWATLIEASDN